MIALALALSIGVQTPAPHPLPEPETAAPPAPQADVEQAPTEKVKYTRWQEAATASGVVSFVGLVIGGVGVPGIVGIVAYAAGAQVPIEGLLGAAVVGGAIGAATGGVIGALPTVEWYGWPVVGAAGAVGSLIGLVPVFLVGVSSKDDPELAEQLSPVQSAGLVLAMAGAGGGAALAGALFALPDEGPEKVTAHKAE